MAFILNIETSGEICSVALSEDDKCLLMKESREKNSHSAKLAVLTDELLKEINISPEKLDSIAVSKGPGSYTGLRIGVSFAKGLCYALNKSLIAIDTLLVNAQNLKLKRNMDDDALICPMTDARRMEVYTALFDNNLNEIKQTQALILDTDSFSDIHQKICFVGSGSTKWKELISQNSNEHFIFVDNIFPMADAMARLSYKVYKENRFENVAYFEPFYLKEFIAGTSEKNKLL